MSFVQTAAASQGRSAGMQPILLAIGFLILILISATSVWLANRSNDDAELVMHTQEVQNRLSLILLSLRRAESAQRGFGLTRQDAYLNEYREAAGNVPKTVENVRAVITDNPEQVQRLNEVAPIVQRKLEEMGRVLALFEQDRFDDAQQIIRAGSGREYMNDVREKVVAMYAAERDLLEHRRADSRKTNNYLLAVSLAGSAVILIIGVVSIYLVRRSLRQREEARDALQIANDNLEMTVQERTADLRLANDEIQRFAYIVSHDLRSPLVNIMGFTSELEAIKKDIFDRVSGEQQSGSPDPQKDLELSRDFDESLGFIKSSIAKMDRLINSILKLSREGSRTFHPEYVSMDALVKSIVDSVTHQAAEKGIDIAVEAMPPVKSDRLALEQIFSNLIDNALKYMQSGRAGKVRIRGHSNHAQVVYEVEDNGRGIAPEDQERIFDLFRRAGHQDQPGEGIGLAHVRALVRRLGGYMSVKSELGAGSTFIITLPRHMQQTEGKAA